MAFKPSKHHKKLINRYGLHNLSIIPKSYSELLKGGTTLCSMVPMTNRRSFNLDLGPLWRYGFYRSGGKQKGKHNAEFNLIASVHASEFQLTQDQSFEHRYEVSTVFRLLIPSNWQHHHQMTLEPSSYTEEKYELFKKYQAEIHNDSSTPGGFERFLITSPLHVCLLDWFSSQLCRMTLKARSHSIFNWSTASSSYSLWILPLVLSFGRKTDSCVRHWHTSWMRV